MSADDQDEIRIREILEAIRIRYNAAAEVAELKWCLFGEKTAGHAPQRRQVQRSKGGPLP